VKRGRRQEGDQGGTEGTRGKEIDKGKTGQRGRDEQGSTSQVGGDLRGSEGKKGRKTLTKVSNDKWAVLLPLPKVGWRAGLNRWERTKTRTVLGLEKYCLSEGRTPRGTAGGVRVVMRTVHQMMREMKGRGGGEGRTRERWMGLLLAHGRMTGWKGGKKWRGTTKKNMR